MEKKDVCQELKQVLNHSIQDTTSRYGGIQLMEQDVMLSNDICTVHTMLENAQRSALLLYADTALLTRLAQRILHSEEVTQQDVEDVAKEYLNIICGQVAAGLFRMAHISSRFESPSFRVGHYLPEGEVACRCELNYEGGHNECMRLLYMGPFQSDEVKPA